jgi:hypothetical protein
MAILDFPNSPTVGQQFTASNSATYSWDGAVWTLAGPTGGGAAGGDLSGFYPNPTVVPAAKSKWTDTGTTLTPSGAAFANKLTLDNAGNLTAGGSNDWRLAGGSGPQKSRMLHMGAFDRADFNYNVNWTGAWTRDDTSKAAGAVSINVSSNRFAFDYWNAAGTLSTPFYVATNSAPPGDLYITGNLAQKNSGTTWINPSDPRLKRDITLYTVGLKAILALEPIAFFYNGKGGTVDDGRQCYGYDASAVQTALPECVGTRRGKLTEKDADEIDLLTLDTSNFTLALVNAVKELNARVVALEGR